MSSATTVAVGVESDMNEVGEVGSRSKEEDQNEGGFFEEELLAMMFWTWVVTNDKTALLANPKRGVVSKAIKPDFLSDLGRESRSFLRREEGSSRRTAMKPVMRAPAAQAMRFFWMLDWISAAGRMREVALCHWGPRAVRANARSWRACCLGVRGALEPAIGGLFGVR